VQPVPIETIATATIIVFIMMSLHLSNGCAMRTARTISTG
jgi:hypothetical protein